MLLTNIRESACIKANLLLNQANSKKGYKSIVNEISKMSETFGIEFDKHVYKSILDELEFRDLKNSANSNKNPKVQFFIQEFPNFLEREDFANSFAMILDSLNTQCTASEVYDCLVRMCKLNQENQLKLLIALNFSEKYEKDVNRVFVNKVKEMEKEPNLSKDNLQILLSMARIHIKNNSNSDNKNKGSNTNNTNNKEYSSTYNSIISTGNNSSTTNNNNATISSRSKGKIKEKTTTNTITNNSTNSTSSSNPPNDIDFKALYKKVNNILLSALNKLNSTQYYGINSSNINNTNINNNNTNTNNTNLNNSNLTNLNNNPITSSSINSNNFNNTTTNPTQNNNSNLPNQNNLNNLSNSQIQSSSLVLDEITYNLLDNTYSSNIDKFIPIEKVFCDLGPLIINNNITLNKSDLINTSIDEKRLARFIIFLLKHNTVTEDKENRYLNKIFLQSLDNDIAMTIDENADKKLNASWNLDNYYKNFISNKTTNTTNTSVDLDYTKLFEFLDDPNLIIKDKKILEYFISILNKLKVPNTHTMIYNFVFNYKWTNESNQLDFISFMINNNVNDILNIKNMSRKVVKPKTIELTIKNNSMNNHLIDMWSCVEITKMLLTISKGNMYLRVREMFEWPSDNIPEILLLVLIEIRLKQADFLHADLLRNVFNFSNNGSNNNMNGIKANMNSNHSGNSMNNNIGINNSSVYVGLLCEEIWNNNTNTTTSSNTNTTNNMSNNTSKEELAANPGLCLLGKEGLMRIFSFLYISSHKDLLVLSRILDICQKNNILNTIIYSLVLIDYRLTIPLALISVKRDFLNLDSWFAEQIKNIGEVFIEAILYYIKDNVLNRFSSVGAASAYRRSATSGNSSNNNSNNANNANNTNNNILESSQLSIDSLILIFSHLNTDKLSKNSSNSSSSISKKTINEITYTYKAIFENYEELHIQGSNVEEVEDKTNKLFDDLFNGEITLEVLIETLEKYKNSNSTLDLDIFALTVYTVLDEYRFFPKYPEDKVKIMGALIGKMISNKMFDDTLEGIAMNYILINVKKTNTNRMYTFACKCLEQFEDKINNWPNFFENLYKLNVKGDVIFERLNERYVYENNIGGNNVIGSSKETPTKKNEGINSSSNNNNSNSFIGGGNLNKFYNNNSSSNNNNSNNPNTGNVNSSIGGVHYNQGFSTNTNNNSNSNNPAINNSNNNSNNNNNSSNNTPNMYLNYNNIKNAKEYIPSSAYGCDQIYYLNEMSNNNNNPNNPNNANNNYLNQTKSKLNNNTIVLDNTNTTNTNNDILDDYTKDPTYKFNSKTSDNNDTTNNNSITNNPNNPNSSFNPNNPSSTKYSEDSKHLRPKLTKDVVNNNSYQKVTEILKDKDTNNNDIINNLNFNPPEIDKINYIFNSMSKLNISDKSMELKNILNNNEILIKWFSSFFIKKRVSPEINNHSVYSELVNYIDNKELNNLLLKDTLNNIKKIFDLFATMTNNNIPNATMEKSILKNLGSWLGLMTLAKNKPILTKDLDLKEIVLEAYEFGKLQVMLPFVCKILESSAKTKVFHVKNPWILAILNILSEIYSKSYMRQNIRSEIDVLSRKLDIEIANLVNAIDTNNKVLDSIEICKESNDVKYDVVNSMSYLETKYYDLFPQINSLDGTINKFLSQLNGNTSSTTCNTGNTNSPPMSKQEFTSILTFALQNSINEILSSVADRAINISYATTKELIFKDFAYEPCENKMKIATSSCMKSLAGSLAMVTCKEPLRTAFINNLKENFIKKSLDSENNMNIISKIPTSSEILEIGCVYIQNFVIKRALEKIDKDKLLNEELDKRKKKMPLGKISTTNTSNTTDTDHTNKDSTKEFNKNIEKLKNLPEILKHAKNGLHPEQIKVYADFEKVFDEFGNIGTKISSNIINSTCGGYNHNNNPICSNPNNPNNGNSSSSNSNSNDIALTKMICLALKEFLNSLNNNKSQANMFDLCMVNIQTLTISNTSSLDNSNIYEDSNSNNNNSNNNYSNFTFNNNQGLEEDTSNFGSTNTSNFVSISNLIYESNPAKILNESELINLGLITFKYITQAAKNHMKILMNIYSEILNGFTRISSIGTNTNNSLKKEITIKLMNNPEDLLIRFHTEIYYFLFKKNIINLEEWEIFFIYYLNDPSQASSAKKLLYELINLKVFNTIGEYAVTNFKKLPSVIFDNNINQSFLELFYGNVFRNIGNTSSNSGSTTKEDSTNIKPLIDRQTMNIIKEDWFQELKTYFKFHFREYVLNLYKNPSDTKAAILRLFEGKNEEFLLPCVMLLTEMTVRYIPGKEEDRSFFYSDFFSKFIITAITILPVDNKIKLFEMCLLGVFRVLTLDYMKSYTNFNQRNYYKIIIGIIYMLNILPNNNELFSVEYNKVSFFFCTS